ncbi:MAG TPA: DUF3667 domain-containing protein [Pyrinomonadaceae bacterium]|jgi:hypothetical protein|nr:DUF3667 domain-containing protein [Pyrinomonadaceae bacterium]
MTKGPGHSDHQHDTSASLSGREDYSLRTFFSHAIHEIFHFDAKVFRSLGPLIARPGFLTVEYFSPRRSQYLKPLQLFILVNVVFFLMKSGGIFHYELAVYEREYAGLIAAKIAASGLTREVYEAIFNTSMHFQQKSYIILLVPLFALVMKLLYPRRYYVEHLVFALNFFSLVLIFLLLAPVPLKLANLFNINVPAGDVMLGLAILVFCGGYLFPGLRRVYGQGIPITIAKTAVLAASVVPLILLYRAVLFFVVLYTT